MSVASTAPRGARAWQLDRLTTGTVALLAAVALVAWADVVFGVADVGSAGETIAFLVGWLTMMAAMMLPSAAPFVLLLGRTAPRGQSAWTMVGAACGYLGLWTLAGVAALAAQSAMQAPAAVVAGVLMGAGAYQLSPLKQRCLTRCRSPLGFVIERWRSGRWAPLRLGWAHGVFCLGCCWALMAVLVAAGAMGVAWVAVIALIVTVEKIAAHGRAIGRLVGVALIGLGVATALQPTVLDALRPTSMHMASP